MSATSTGPLATPPLRPTPPYTVTSTYVSDEGFGLGWWLTNLRNRSSSLTVERRVALEQLDPEWNPPWPRPWHRGLIQARRYRREHGHLDVPRSYRTADGYGLGEWLHTQRARSAGLTRPQRAALRALGAKDTLPAREQQWQTGMSAAAEFHRERGHLRVPRDYVTGDGFKLGRWIENARRRH
ncbi:helicase associated domain-containing protein [Micromonospora aurantiaca (nom. illeg.)]|uniref:helicase associated domain-containing protein n=1 Tax=Micromonospora aurantiaca (nom. illeg.) TaxID=47850 RepID=UPI003400BE84